MKRKASNFEEDDLYALPHNPRSTTPSPASSSPLSTSTIQSSSRDAQHPHDLYRVKAVPYWNSRTRKRYRDNRPNEESIHESTLKKLYDAQRLHLDETMPMTDVLGLDEQDGRTEYDAEMTDDPPEAEIPHTIQRNQQSIDAFFGRRGAAQSKAPGASASENQSFAFRMSG